MSAPIAPKAQAGGIAAAVSGAALWILGKYVFKGDVPDGIASLIYVAVPGIVAFAAAYLAPHQVRPGDTPAVVPPVAAPHAALTSSSSLNAEQMAAVREALNTMPPSEERNEKLREVLAPEQPPPP